LEGTKSWRTQQVVYGRERTLVLTFNPNLYDSQWATVQNDLAQALSQLAALQQHLQNRAAGLIQGGTAPTLESVRRKCEQILHRQHLRQLVQATVSLNSAAMPQLSYQAKAQAQQQLKDTYLGKTLLITGHKEWTDAQVIRAYRSQFVIEEIFHEMKNRHLGAWWPLHHWTDSKIQVHGLYCTIAVLLRALLWRRAHTAGLHLSMSALLEKLGQMRQVINVFPSKRVGQPKPEQTVLTQRDDTQEKLIEILGLRTVKSAI
jgi:transposase